MILSCSRTAPDETRHHISYILWFVPRAYHGEIPNYLEIFTTCSDHPVRKGYRIERAAYGKPLKYAFVHSIRWTPTMAFGPQPCHDVMVRVFLPEPHSQLIENPDGPTF